MEAEYSTKDSKVPNTWYVAPLVWAIIAALSFIVAPDWEDLLADPAQGQLRGSDTVLSAAPTARADEMSVPAASSVFTERSSSGDEHVQAF